MTNIILDDILNRLICLASLFYGGLAQLGEHLPYKQGVTGSSPVSSIYFADVAELADAQDLGSCIIYDVRVQVPSSAFNIF